MNNPKIQIEIKKTAIKIHFLTIQNYLKLAQISIRIIVVSVPCLYNAIYRSNNK